VDVDVLIVGAGPTGLAVGAECVRSGFSFRMIDRAETATEHSGAFVLQPRTLEQLERYGVASKFLAAGAKIHALGLFAGRKHVVDLSLAGTRSVYDYLLALPQRETERLLVEMLEQHGPAVESGTEALSFDQDAERVQTRVRHPDGEIETVVSRYVVAADGAAGGVREKLGIGWTPVGRERRYLVADARVTGRAEIGDEIRTYVRKGSTFTIARLDGRLCRLLVAENAVAAEPDADADADATLEPLQRALALFTGADWRIGKPGLLARYACAPGRATRLREGRIFLAGDAAAVHSPLSCQGMNAGLGDAANLVWKLAAARGAATGALVESYEAERGPLAMRLLATADKALGSIHATNPAVVAVRDAALPRLMRYGPFPENLRAYVAQTDVAYRTSPIVRDHGGGSRVRAGDRAPDAMIYGHNETRQQFSTWFMPTAPLVLFVDMNYNVRLLFRDAWPAARLLAIRFAKTEDDPGALRYQQDGEFSQTYVGGGDAIVYAFRPDGHVGFRGDGASVEKLAAYAKLVDADAAGPPAANDAAR